MAKPKKPAPPATNSPPTWPRLDLAPPARILRALLDWARVILCADEADHLLSAEDRAIVEQAVQQLNALGLARLAGMADPTTLQREAAIAAAAYVIGAHGAMTDTAQRFFEQSQTDGMQLGHKATFEIERQELDAAIRAEVEAAIRKDDEQASRSSRTRYHPIISGHLHPDANAICEGVNARLKAICGVSNNKNNKEGKDERKMKPRGPATIARRLKVLYPNRYSPRQRRQIVRKK